MGMGNRGIWALLWVLGVPLPVLVIAYLLLGGGCQNCRIGHAAASLGTVTALASLAGSKVSQLKSFRSFNRENLSHENAPLFFVCDGTWIVDPGC